MEEIEVATCVTVVFILYYVYTLYQKIKKAIRKEYTGSENGSIETLQDGHEKLSCKGDNFVAVLYVLVKPHHEQDIHEAEAKC